MRNPRLLLSLMLFFPLTSPLLAAADEQAAPVAPAGQACRAEFQKLCGHSKRGDGQVRQCIDQHRAEFSPACQQQMAEHQERARQKAEACRIDVEQFCKGMEPGGGRIKRCLKENETKLSPTCRDSLARHGSRSRDRRDPQS
jgi:hypothetical protein